MGIKAVVISRVSILAAFLFLCIWPASAQTGASPQSGITNRPLERSLDAGAEKRPATRNLVLVVRTRAKVHGVIREKIQAIPLSTMKNAAQGAPPLDNTFRISIPRYTDSYIYGLALYEYPWGAPCFWLESGAWTLTASGSDLGTARTTIETRPGPCNTNADFATVYYQWNSHTNHTRTPEDGPLDTFVGEWKASGYDYTYNFVVFVDPVRPTGEVTKFDGWGGFPGGAVGQWKQTLVPPDDDPGFDFSGEWVRERFVGGLTTCPLPPVAAVPSVGKRNYGSSWPVRSGNVWGPDGVGFGNDRDSLCALQYARCKISICMNTKFQQMTIKSPADFDFVDYGIQNSLVWVQTGQAISDLKGDTYSFGMVGSSRVVGTGVAPQYNGFATFNACPKSIVPLQCH